MMAFYVSCNGHTRAGAQGPYHSCYCKSRILKFGRSTVRVSAGWFPANQGASKMAKCHSYSTVHHDVANHADDAAVQPQIIVL